MEKKVMIVDDEPDVLSALKMVLEKQNYEVITVRNGYECLKHLESGFKGVILMDLMMPHMDGWDTIREIVRRGYIKDVVISIITGKGTKDSKKLNELGSFVFDYLTKPLNKDQIVSCVESCNKYLYRRYT